MLNLVVVMVGKVGPLRGTKYSRSQCSLYYYPGQTCRQTKAKQGILFFFSSSLWHAYKSLSFLVLLVQLIGWTVLTSNRRYLSGLDSGGSPVRPNRG